MRWFTRRHPGGATSENEAARHLESIGLRIVERNAASSLGEIDLVAEDPRDGTVVFVEVKGRTGNSFGSALESVTPKKRRTLAKLAAAYLQTNRLSGRPVRFDVVAVETTEGRSALRHIPNAFSLDRI